VIRFSVAVLICILFVGFCVVVVFGYGFWFNFYSNCYKGFV
jgi:hypothetical protein